MSFVMLAGCAAAAEKPTEVIVFAAASMTETITKLKDMYDGYLDQ